MCYHELVSLGWAKRHYKYILALDTKAMARLSQRWKKKTPKLPHRGTPFNFLTIPNATRGYKTNKNGIVAVV